MTDRVISASVEWCRQMHTLAKELKQAAGQAMSEIPNAEDYDDLAGNVSRVRRVAKKIHSKEREPVGWHHETV